MRLVIVGGGARGVLLACHLLRSRTDGLEVTLVEKRPDVGRGIAYYTANPDHLLNVRAGNMSAFSDQPDHFWRWLSERQNSGQANWQPCEDPFCFAPRQVYGDYIASLVAPLMREGERPSGLRVIRGECTSIDSDSTGVTANLADGSQHRGDAAVLATGYETPASRMDCFVDPWAPPADAGVKKDARVLILGTGLTMVDYVLALVLAGHEGPIIALSRRGLLPHAHRSVQPFAVDETDIPFGAGLTALVRWLRGTASKHEAQGGDWRSVVDGLRPFTQRIWQGLGTSARRRFLEHARPWWDIHRHRMAPQVRERIDAAIASGALTVIAAKFDAIEPAASGAATVRYRPRGAATSETMEVDKIVDCRGIGVAPLEIANPVLSGLLERGAARLDPLRIGLDVTTDCALIGRDGVASRRLFAIGPITRAAFWEIVAVPDIRNQCAMLASRLLRRGASDHYARGPKN